MTYKGRNKVIKNMNDKKDNWSVVGVWNDQLTFGKKDRKLKPRERVWASEIGKDLYERYLKMTAVPPDIGYNDRTLRKFAAGDFFERIIGFVLISAGLLKADNKWYNIPETDKHLEVSVKPDFIAGGKPNWDRVREDLRNNPFFEIMPVLQKISEALVNQLAEKHPNGLKDIVYEIKSINSMVFWAKKDYLLEAYPHHQMQLFTGMKATGIPEGRLLYISKDDLTTEEFIVNLNDPKLIERYEKDLDAITYAIRNKIPPKKPDDIIFDEKKKLRFQYLKRQHIIEGCYTDNYAVGWSNYLPTITGFKTADKWKDSIKPKIKELNDKLKEDVKVKLVKSQEILK